MIIRGNKLEYLFFPQEKADGMGALPPEWSPNGRVIRVNVSFPGSISVNVGYPLE